MTGDAAAPHVFVVMPFGVKGGVDFDAVFADLIEPSLSSDFKVFRADQEHRAGDIRPDMFQELLLADLVVADISIDNPNVWYELGVRHALRARGVVQIQSGRERLPFDVSVDRTLAYHVRDGVPDPEFLEGDRAALGTVVAETLRAWHGRKVSPVYSLLPYLQEPEWRKLRVAGAGQFWEEYEAWRRRIEIARKQNLPGDILALAREGPTRVLRLAGHKTAGKALRGLGQFTLALEQYEIALEIDPFDIESRQQKGLLLGRLGRADAAQEWLEDLLKEQESRDAESLATLGRIHKEAWISLWRRPDFTPEQMRGEAAYEDAGLTRAIEPYAAAFLQDPGHYYSGINALTLALLHQELTGRDAPLVDAGAITGAIRWAARSALHNDPDDYWAAVTLGDLDLLTADPAEVAAAYKAAVALADKDWFALDASRQQLRLLQDLGFRPEHVLVGLAVFDRALARLNPPQMRWQPRSVFLFSGHMIDRPGREPRFPPDKEAPASEAIAGHLDALGAGELDLAICGGACGGDLIFAEHCLARGLRLTLHIPAPEPQFLRESVVFAGQEWGQRYQAVKASPRTTLRVMPDELGEEPQGVNRFERNNLWQLYSALAYGPQAVAFIGLWDGHSGEGPGGTEHMVRTVAAYSGRVHVLDPAQLW